MEEIEKIKEMIETFKETLAFLVEQEKIRGEEVVALNKKIEAVNDTLVNQIINPSIEAFKDEQFKNFQSKYADKLDKYDDLIKTATNDPDYNSTKEAWENLQEMPEEDKMNVDENAYVDEVEKGLKEYVNNIKAKLGIPEDANVEITEEDGAVSVKADTDGDGSVDTEVATEEEKEVPVEEDGEIDPELQKELEEYLKK